MSHYRLATVLVLVVVASGLSLIGGNQQTANSDEPGGDKANSSSTASQPTTATWSLDQGWQIPVSVPENPTQDDWYDMGWQTMIALNWPAEWSQWPSQAPAGVSGGQPDETASILKAKTPYVAVWQTYLAPEQVFIANGNDPGGWNSPENPLNTKVDSATGETLLVLGGFSKGVAASDEKSGEFNEATSQPLIAQDGNYVNYEMRMNESEFTYVTHYQFYNSANQVAATKNGGTIPPLPKTGTEAILDLPAWAQQGALEVKASWRIISNKQFANRYFTMKAFRELPDDTVDGPYLFGLVGFHILRLTPQSGSTWFWATFEQVDNVQIDERPVPAGLTPSFNPGQAPPYPTYGDIGFQYNGMSTPPAPIKAGEPLPASNPVHTSFLPNMIQSGAVASDNKFQPLLAGTVWQYYQMIGTLNPGTPNSQYKVAPFSNPTNAGQLTNTTIETYSMVGTPPTPSCFDCHAYGTPLGAEVDKNGYPTKDGNQIFSFLLNDAQPPLKAK